MSEREELVKSLHELYNQLQADGWQYYSLRGNGLHTISRAIAFLSSQEDVRDGVLEEAAFYHDDKAAEYEVQARLAERPGAELKRAVALRVAAEHQQYAADIRALKSNTAEKCEHEEGDSEYGGRGKCVKCGLEYTATQPTQEALTPVEESVCEEFLATIPAGEEGELPPYLLTAVKVLQRYIDRRLAEKSK